MPGHATASSTSRVFPPRKWAASCQNCPCLVMGGWETNRDCIGPVRLARPPGRCQWATRTGAQRCEDCRDVSGWNVLSHMPERNDRGSVDERALTTDRRTQYGLKQGTHPGDGSFLPFLSCALGVCVCVLRGLVGVPPLATPWSPVPVGWGGQYTVPPGSQVGPGAHCWVCLTRKELTASKKIWDGARARARVLRL